MSQPDTTGPYRFRGIRRVPNRGEIVKVSGVVEVRRVFRGRDLELAVAFFGKARIYPLRDFEGEWEKVKP